MQTHDNYEYEMGMYDDRAAAENAVEKLQAMGYTKHDISVMMDDKTREKEFAERTGTHAADGIATGAVVGGAIGALVAGFTATGSIAAVAATGGAALPFVVGPLAAAVAGAGAGGATGGIVGGLIGAGIPEKRAKKYEQRLHNGGILVGVKPRPEHRDQLRNVFPEDDEF